MGLELSEHTGVISASATGKGLLSDDERACPCLIVAGVGIPIKSRNVGLPATVMILPEMEEGWYDVGRCLRLPVGNRLGA